MNGYCGQGHGQGGSVGILGDSGSDACWIACNAMDGEGVVLLQAPGEDVDGDHGGRGGGVGILGDGGSNAC